MVAERHEHAVARTQPRQRRKGEAARLGAVDEVAGDAHEVRLQRVHAAHVRGELGDVEMLADVEVGDVHDAKADERRGKVTNRHLDVRHRELARAEDIAVGQRGGDGDETRVDEHGVRAGDMLDGARRDERGDQEASERAEAGEAQKQRAEDGREGERDVAAQ